MSMEASSTCTWRQRKHPHQRHLRNALQRIRSSTGSIQQRLARAARLMMNQLISRKLVSWREQYVALGTEALRRCDV
jgi:hypothetical protein